MNDRDSLIGKWQKYNILYKNDSATYYMYMHIHVLYMHQHPTLKKQDTGTKCSLLVYRAGT